MRLAKKAPHLLKGQRAEDNALAFLAARGWQLVERNFSCRYGEIDLICHRNNELAFVEVRFRNESGFVDGVESIDERKRRRLIATAEYFLQIHREFDNVSCRFDVIAITDTGGTPAFNWIENAFDAAD